MDELIVKVLNGEATDFELRQLERWRSASRNHESEFQSLKALWARSSEVPLVEVPAPPPVSKILEEGDRLRKRESVRLGARKMFHSPFLGIGLSAAAVVALLFVGFRDRGDTGTPRPALSPVETASTAGEVTTMGLSDGSVVRLAPGSVIEFPPTPGGRNVTVEGKAFFAVASGEDPFVVQTPVGVVRVTGTRFEVDADEVRLRVIVLEGLVEVEGVGGGLQVGPGQIAYLTSGGTPRIEDGGQVRDLLAWPGGLMVFQDTPFAEVAKEVGEHFGVEFQVPSGEMASRRITAWFGEEPLEEVVRGVCMVAGVGCDMENDRVVVR